MKPTILYITYDGILEPLGQSQVLRYQERLVRDHKIVLTADDHHFSELTFGK